MNSYLSLYFSRDRLLSILLVLTAAIIYLPFLGNPLVFDDVPFFRNVLHFADAHFDLTLRWFSSVSFGVTAVFFEGPEAFRLGNLLLHCMNVLLLLLVLRMWISVLLPEEARGSMAALGAWLGALVFACHPLAVYGVGYLVQRSILMATMFVLLMHLAFFRGALGGDRRYLALAVVCYFLAVFSKEHSLLAPAILLPMIWVVRKRLSVSTGTLLLTMLGFLFVALVVLARVKGVLGQAYEKDAAILIGGGEVIGNIPQLHLLSLLTQAGLFFKYIFLMLMPNPAWMSIDMRETFIMSATNWKAWQGGVAYLLFGAAALWLLCQGGRKALCGVAMLYPWILFLTEFSSVRVQEIFVLYRAYLWMPGVMLIFPLLLGRLKMQAVLATGAVLVLLLTPLAWNRMWVFADTYRLWDDAVRLLDGEDKLGSHRIYYNRAMASSDKKEWKAAIPDLEKAIAINRNYPEVNTMLGNAYMNEKRYAEALVEYDKAIVSLPTDPHAYFGKGFVLKRMNDEKQSLLYMKKSCELGMDAACVIVSAAPYQMRRDSARPTFTP